MCTEDQFLASQVDPCVVYLERSGATTRTEAYRNAQNALTYVFFGDEKALAFVTESEFINKNALRGVVAWAAEHVGDKEYTRRHIDTLRTYLD